MQGGPRKGSCSVTRSCRRSARKVLPLVSREDAPLVHSKKVCRLVINPTVAASYLAERMASAVRPYETERRVATIAPQLHGSLLSCGGVRLPRSARRGYRAEPRFQPHNSKTEDANLLR